MEDFNVTVLGNEMINKNGLFIEKEIIHSYHSHTHIYYEIILYEPFVGNITVNGLNYSVDKPTILFMTPGDIHSTYVSSSSKSSFYKVCFTSAENIATTSSCPVILNIEGKFEFFKQLFDNALANEKNFLYLQTTIQLIVLELENKKNPNRKERDKKTLLVSSAMQLINQHFTENITLESIAEQLFVTPQYLSAQFTKVAKITFMNYLKDKRLSYAATLLLKSKNNVTEVCFASGYGNLSHFIRQFKQKYNTTPNKFKE